MSDNPELFNEALGDDFFKGYDYLTIKQDTPLHSSKYLIEGIFSLANINEFLLMERKIPLDNFSRDELTKIAMQELDLFDPGKEDGYDSFSVELGRQDIGIYNYLQNQEMYREVLNPLILSGPKTPIYKKNLIDLISKNNPVPTQNVDESSKEAFLEKLSISHPELENAEDYIGLFIVKSLGEAASFSFFSETNVKILQIFEQLQVLQENNLRDIETVKWNISMENTIYNDKDTGDALNMAGLNYLRAIKFYDIEKRSENNPRIIFDNHHRWSLKDEFRRQLAINIGAYKERLALKKIHGDLEVCYFETQYNMMIPEGQKSFDRLAVDKLEAIASKNSDKNISDIDIPREYYNNLILPKSIN